MSGEQTITFRQPATANLMIDSRDRVEAQYLRPWNFQITKKQSIQNGFFTRIGTTEVVLEWIEPNISSDLSNNFLSVDISGATGVLNDHIVSLPSGFYTVKQVLDSLVIELNDLSGTTGSTFSVVASGTTYGIQINTGVWTVNDTVLNNFLTLLSNVSTSLNVPLSPNLQSVRYLDFVSSQLTYNQNLKDNSTNSNNRDVLCRWYFADDVPEAVDAYGFPIYMGYRPFMRRRLFNPPKQINWSSQQPIGNIAFEVYADNGVLVQTYNGSDWLMTLQLSEN